MDGEVDEESEGAKCPRDDVDEEENKSGYITSVAEEFRMGLRRYEESVRIEEHAEGSERERECNDREIV